MGGLIEKAGSACEESEDNDGVIYWVNVSQSSGAGSPEMSRIKDLQTVVVVMMAATDVKM